MGGTQKTLRELRMWTPFTEWVEWDQSRELLLKTIQRSININDSLRDCNKTIKENNFVSTDTFVLSKVFYLHRVYSSSLH